MKSSLSKKASITLPPDIKAGLHAIAKKEHRTFSGVLQEAARTYLGLKQFESLQAKLAAKARELGLTEETDLDGLIHSLRKQ